MPSVLADALAAPALLDSIDTPSFLPVRGRAMVTGSPGKEILELQPLDLAGQPPGQTANNLETDSRTVAVRVQYHSPIIVDDMTIYISYMHGFL